MKKSFGQGWRGGVGTDMILTPGEAAVPRQLVRDLSTLARSCAITGHELHPDRYIHNEKFPDEPLKSNIEAGGCTRCWRVKCALGSLQRL